jgi:hypothetical protein
MGMGAAFVTNPLATIERGVLLTAGLTVGLAQYYINHPEELTALLGKVGFKVYVAGARAADALHLRERWDAAHSEW